MEKFSKLLLIIIIYFLASCAAVKTRKQIEAEKSTSSTVVRENETQQVNSEDLEEEKQDSGFFGSSNDNAEEAKKIPSVGLILGPGGAKAFAFTGVLKKFEQSKIKIEQIYGLEWGSLVAGLYAHSGKVNQVEWALYKMNQKDFLKTSYFSDKLERQHSESLDPFLKKYLQGKPMSSMDFSCPVVSSRTGSISWKSQVNRNVLKQCISFPPLFKTKNSWLASAFSLDKAIERMKSKGIGLVIYVDVLGTASIFPRNDKIKSQEAKILWYEMQRVLTKYREKADFVIGVDTEGINLYDFEKRSSLVLKGERAGEQALKELTEKYGF